MALAITPNPTSLPLTPALYPYGCSFNHIRLQPPPHTVAASATYGCRQCAELLAAAEEAGMYEGAVEIIEVRVMIGVGSELGLGLGHVPGRRRDDRG
jgi:hypothetical protein